MDILTDEIILKELQSRLSKLKQEEKQAELDSNSRKILIEKTKLAIEAFNEKPEIVNSKNIIINSNSSINYPNDGTWHERIIAYMKYYNKALTISELTEGMMEYEPDYTKDKLHGALSNMMTSLVKRGDSMKYVPTGEKMKGNYYSSPLWYDDKGELKEEHRPSKVKKSLWDK
jgi:hypothetical protein